jgi:uncharacterized protein YjiS (DUF1127 family)
MSEPKESRTCLTPAMWPAQNATARLIGGMYGIVADASAAVKIWRRQEALQQQLQRLSNFDLADIGIARPQIPAVARSQDAPALLRQMLARLGIPETALQKDRALRHRVHQACATCFSRAYCRRWLRTGQPAEGYKAFCPNTEEFEALLPKS